MADFNELYNLIGNVSESGYDDYDDGEDDGSAFVEACNQYVIEAVSDITDMQEDYYTESKKKRFGGDKPDRPFLGDVPVSRPSSPYDGSSIPDYSNPNSKKDAGWGLTVAGKRRQRALSPENQKAYDSKELLKQGIGLNVRQKAENFREINSAAKNAKARAERDAQAAATAAANKRQQSAYKSAAGRKDQVGTGTALAVVNKVAGEVMSKSTEVASQGAVNANVAAKEGNVKKIGAIIAATVSGIGAITLGGVKYSKYRKTTEARIKAIEKKAAAIQKKCDAGKISAKEAKDELKKLSAEMKAIQKEAIANEKAAAKEAAAKQVKESVDMNDILIQIYESADSGEITDEERDALIDLAQAYSDDVYSESEDDDDAFDFMDGDDSDDDD